MEYPQFSFQSRLEDLSLLNDRSVSSEAGARSIVYDAVIIGGGIVGAGLARELSIRGIKTLLVEKNDFASGTSSKSSKLIHGGLRYLEMMDFHLVFESLAERHWLLETHPHLVQPLEFNLPIYTKKLAPPGARSSSLLGIGLWIYDALSLFRTPFFHGRHTREQMENLFPNLRNEGLQGGYYYADAMMLDDELVLETLLDAKRRGAKPLNYVEATKVSRQDQQMLYRVDLRDTLASNAKEFSVQAKEVIVCVGPWTESFGEKVQTGAARKLKPSKGVHFIVPWKRFPIDRCLVMYSPDGRIIFAIPRKDLGAGAEVVILGTTDSAEKQDPGRVAANSEDFKYLFGVLKNYFPKADLSESDIIASFAGVRPLIDSGEQSEAKTSREHEIWRNKAGVVFMAGGKYTTFRKISQEIADFSFPHTRKKPEFEAESKKQLSTPEDYSKRLAGKPIWGRFTDEWLRWKIEHHAPCTLEDLIYRRTPMWMDAKNILENPMLIDEIGTIAKASFQWTDEQLETQKEKLLESLRRTRGILQ